ncbi:MAG: N-acetylmuramoyl-L-alanine amidase, partial [Ignavibacteriae bacterium]|nr:N-acetylmuramoyl-L-alanine amidase [Ignavibacteriota bacterium]
ERARSQTKADLADISICLDPSHGLGADGSFANKGAYGFSETEKALSVALHLKSMLESSGVGAVILTRNSNTAEVSLTQRTAIANNYNVDWFHSIHSNAAPENLNPASINYSMVLLEERREKSDSRFSASTDRGAGTGSAYWSGKSDAMATLMADKLARAHRILNSGMRLDWTFYGGLSGGFTLGVLRSSMMPSTLSEGAFHTHPAQNLRDMNDEYRRAEARALWMSFLEYYGIKRPAVRTVLGVVRQHRTGIPLNDATVETSGRSYKTNSYFDTFRSWEVFDSTAGNGIFYFENLPAGRSPFTFRADGYRDTTIFITVADTFFTFQDIQLRRAYVTSVAGGGEPPLEFSLEQNYPNPFNPTTSIEFTLPEAGKVRLDILNLLGELVSTLVDENREAGTYQVTWNGTNTRGSVVPSGVYFYKLRHGSATLTRKMVFVR